jgi:putative phosphoesterase
MARLPAALFERLAGVDMILHAGDLDDPAILEELAQIAPTQAVRGNIHLQAMWPNDRGLPLYLDLAVAGRRILVSHGHLTLWNSLVEKLWLFLPGAQARANRNMMRRLARTFPGADAYVFGHSHLPMVEWRDGALFVNPGAVCPTRGVVPTVARLEITPEGMTAEILPL